MGKEDAVGEDAAGSPADLPAGEILAGRWACGLGSALVILLAATEAAHWQAVASQGPRSEQVVQQLVPVSSPSSHPDVSAPDPGDNP